MARQRNPKTHGDRKLRKAARAPKESGQIVRQGILRASHPGARNQVKKSGRARGDFHQALIGGRGRGQENRIQMMRLHDFAILRRFFRREIGNENSVSPCFRGRCGKFLQTHLENGIEVAEEHQGHLAGLANLPHK